MTLTQRIGDTVTHTIPMAWKGRPFAPGGAWFLIFTVKSDAYAETDAQASFQKTTNLGITVLGNKASIAVIPANTAGSVSPAIPALPPGTYYWDVQAQSLADPEDVRTVASGTLALVRDVTRGTETAVPIYIADPGVTYDNELVIYQ